MIVIDSMNKKRLQWNIENKNRYDYNQTFTNESNFGIK